MDYSYCYGDADVDHGFDDDLNINYTRFISLANASSAKTAPFPVDLNLMMAPIKMDVVASCQRISTI